MKITLVTVLSLSALAAPLQAQSLLHDLLVDPEQVEISNLPSGIQVSLPGHRSSAPAGQPDRPAIALAAW